MGFFIYRVTNKVNGKIYIGQTKTTVEERWKAHIAESKYPCRHTYNTVFKRAIRKYGIENFICEQIEECSNQKQLSEREQYWIAYYHSFIGDKNSNGYNMTRGGEEGSGSYYEKEVYELDILSGQIINKYISSHDAARQHNNNSAIRYSCSNPYLGKITNGHCYVYKDFYIEFDNIKTGYLYPVYNPIVGIDMDLTKILLYLKVSQYSNDPKRYNQILDCIKQNKKEPEYNHTRYGYYWYTWNDLPNIRIKRIGQYNKVTGKLEHSYTSIKEAARTMVIDSSCISRAVNGKRETSKGYIWKQCSINPLKEVMPICTLLK